MTRNCSKKYYEEIKVWRETAERLTKYGLYDPAHEHDACGVGMVANIKGVASHSIIKLGLENLCSLEHRGAIGADPETGDGAGLLIQLSLIHI